jgi:hypothetical protein
MNEGARALARSPHLGGLVRLNLAENPIGEGSWRAVRRRFGSAVASPERERGGKGLTGVCLPGSPSAPGTPRTTPRS